MNTLPLWKEVVGTLAGISLIIGALWYSFEYLPSRRESKHLQVDDLIGLILFVSMLIGVIVLAIFTR